MKKIMVIATMVFVMMMASMTSYASVMTKEYVHNGLLEGRFEVCDKWPGGKTLSTTEWTDEDIMRNSYRLYIDEKGSIYCIKRHRKIGEAHLVTEVGGRIVTDEIVAAK